MVPEDLFESPKRVLRWARKQILNLVEAGDAFLKTNPYAVREKLDFLTKDILIKLYITAPIPDEVEEGAYRIVGTSETPSTKPATPPPSPSDPLIQTRPTSPCATP